MQNSQLVLDALKEVITSSEHNEKVIREYFSLYYQQIVNGSHLDFQKFIDHMAVIKQETKRMTLTVLASALQGDTVFTHHQVVVDKRDNTVASFEIFARFTVIDNKIVKCEELTRMVEGKDCDQNFGSKH